MQSYDYQRRHGVETIAWDRFVSLAESLAEALQEDRVEAVVGIARAGLFPATLVACALRAELYPARLTRRLRDRVVYPEPVWKVDISAEVKEQRIAVIDEIADTGQTLALAADRARQLGASHVITATLACHTWAEPKPDMTALRSDALLIFPWDRRVLRQGQWELHPELAEALRKQGLDLPESE